MGRRVRPIAFLLGLVLLQLVLVESGFACRMPGDAAPGGAAMAGMSMNADAGVTTSRTAQHDRQEAPCRFPWTAAGCQSMAPCAPSAVTAASSTLAMLAPARVVPAQLVLLVPPALFSAPELPPPRA